MPKHPSSSREQIEVEDCIRELLSQRLGVKLRRKNRATVAFKHWLGPVVDAYCEDPKILVEIYAHVGVLKAAQKHKVINDIFKLISCKHHSIKWAEARLIFVFADKRARSSFLRGWASGAAEKWNVEIQLVEPPSDLSNAVRSAQLRQNRSKLHFLSSLANSNRT